MKKNVGKPDSIVRIAVAVVVALLYLSGIITGVTAIILGIVAVVFATTAITGLCPIYMLLGLSTRKRKVA